MNNIAPFDSFNTQQEFNEYVLRREAEAVVSGLCGLAQAMEDVKMGSEFTPKFVSTWTRNIAASIERMFGE